MVIDPSERRVGTTRRVRLAYLHPATVVDNSSSVKLHSHQGEAEVYMDIRCMTCVRH